MAEANINTQVRKQSLKDYAVENMMASSVDKPITDVLVKHLHETLDVYKLLDDFNLLLKTKVICDGIEYNDVETQTYLLNGTIGQPSCIYTLRYEEEILGTISLSRDSIFLDYEIETIEVLLAGLTLPLRNALHYKKAAQFSQRDELTELRNGNYYHDVAELEINRAHRYKTPFSIVLFDIDNFSLINNQYGRATGDAVLISVAKSLEEKARSSDIVYRNNGDEFLVFLPNTGKAKATEAAQRIKDFVLAKTYFCHSSKIDFTLSTSVATVAYEDTAYTLMDRARKFLLHEKALRSNNPCMAQKVKQIQVGNQ